LARKKTNTKSNILSAWKKAGLVSFDSDIVLEKLPKIKKYTSEAPPLSIVWRNGLNHHTKRNEEVALDGMHM
jgi:hypothetical protein